MFDVRTLIRRDTTADVSTVSSVREFRKLVSAECNRADRYGRRFSLAVFEIPSFDKHNITARQLVRSLHERFRKIDEVGWLDRNQIAVILPYTVSEGAWKLAEDICKLVSSVAVPPPFTVYTYPSTRWPAFLMRGGILNFNPVRWLQRLTAGSSIHKMAEFRSMMEQERDRADRNKHIFSLILFDMGKVEASDISLAKLIQEMTLRLRITDAIGWHDQQHIGVLLPYASYDNACRIAEGLYRSTTQIHAVYTYPSRWFSIGRDQAGRTHQIQSEIADRGRGGQPDRQPRGRRNDDQALQPKTVDAINAIASADAQRVQEEKAGFVPFFVKPMPTWKRTMDVAGALVGISASMPLSVPIMFAIKATSKGPVFFRQLRAGLGGKPFAVYKFRSMEIDAESRKKDLMTLNERTGPAFKLTNDPRVTTVGSFIRKWSLDEIPQFLNVLRGDMSLVGPRPPTMDEVMEYYHWHDKRLEVKPGITCLWQVFARHQSSFDDWVRLDIKYARTYSLGLDLKILALTLPAVLSHRGAN